MSLFNNGLAIGPELYTRGNPYGESLTDSAAIQATNDTIDFTITGVAKVTLTAVSIPVTQAILDAGNGINLNIGSSSFTSVAQVDTWTTGDGTSVGDIKESIIVYEIPSGTPLVPIDSGNDKSHFASTTIKVEYLKHHKYRRDNGVLDLEAEDIDDNFEVIKTKVDSLSMPTGLEAIDEGNGIGWKIIGYDSTKYGVVGRNAINMSLSDSTSDTIGATGENCVCIGGKNNRASRLNSTCAGGDNNEATGEDSACIGGRNNTASHYQSVCAGGDNNEATGENCVCIGGKNNTASHYQSVCAGGAFNKASGESSACLGGTGNPHTGADANQALGFSTACIGGRSLNATSKYSTVIGKNNAFNATIDNHDVLFIVGNGADINNRTNALEVRTSGGVIAPTSTIALINNDKSLVTREYSDKINNTTTVNRPVNPILYTQIWDDDLSKIIVCTDNTDTANIWKDAMGTVV